VYGETLGDDVGDDGDVGDVGDVGDEGDIGEEGDVGDDGDKFGEYAGDVGDEY
jgi:hypothetical protein